MFDPDSAGRKAERKALRTFSEFSIRLARLDRDPGETPASELQRAARDAGEYFAVRAQDLAAQESPELIREGLIGLEQDIGTLGPETREASIRQAASVLGYRPCSRQEPYRRQSRPTIERQESDELVLQFLWALYEDRALERRMRPEDFQGPANHELIVQALTSPDWRQSPSGELARYVARITASGTLQASSREVIDACRSGTIRHWLQQADQAEQDSRRAQCLEWARHLLIKRDQS